MTDLTNQVALVTGAGDGIGKASAMALAAAGATVIVNDIDGAHAQATADAIMTGQRRAVPVQADVGDVQQIDRMVREALAAFGQIDILVNNAGVTPLVVLSSSAKPDRIKDVPTFVFSHARTRQHQSDFRIA
jgi:NAD(P)-dependent dehydrogenase (short-subunit alcohol dehydrogenase family)